MGASKEFSLYRLTAIGMPLLAVVTVTAMGSELLHASHALAPDTVTSQSKIATNLNLPTGASTACCSLQTTALSIHRATTERVTVAVQIKNITNSTEQISPGLQFTLIDASGDSHPYTAAYLSPDTVIGGPLAGGRSVTLNLDFDLAPSETPRYLQFQYDAASQQILLGLPS